METQIIREGEIELEVPRLETYRTSPQEYVPSQTPVFFNPLMELSRDISVAFLHVLAEELGQLYICDVMAGVGARALRYAKEVEDVKEVVANDRSSEAVKLIHRNVKRNKLRSVLLQNKNAGKLLQDHRPRFQVIDLDPFGSPAPFLDSACSSITRKGAILVTATDTATLCGTHPKACQRKYGSKPLRTPYCHEIGLRILIGSCQRVGSKYDLALYPLLSHSIRHYFRIYLKVRKGARRADAVLKEQGHVSHCFGCGRREITSGIPPILPGKCKCGGKFKHSGPIWVGGIFDREFAKLTNKELLRRNFNLNRDAQKLMSLCINEAKGPPTFYEIHRICARLGISPPKLDKLVRELEKQGYFASRTHFSDTGIRTNASIEELQKTISKSK